MQSTSNIGANNALKVYKLSILRPTSYRSPLKPIKDEDAPKFTKEEQELIDPFCNQLFEQCCRSGVPKECLRDDFGQNQAYFDSFDKFEKMILQNSDYVLVVITKETSEQFRAFCVRIFVFLCSRPEWGNRFIFCKLGEPFEIFMDDVIPNDVLEYSNEELKHNKCDFFHLFEFLKLDWRPFDKENLQASHRLSLISITSDQIENQENDKKESSLSNSDINKNTVDESLIQAVEEIIIQENNAVEKSLKAAGDDLFLSTDRENKISEENPKLKDSTSSGGPINAQLDNSNNNNVYETNQNNPIEYSVTDAVIDHLIEKIVDEKLNQQLIKENALKDLVSSTPFGERSSKIKPLYFPHEPYFSTNPSDILGPSRSQIFHSQDQTNQYGHGKEGQDSSNSNNSNMLPTNDIYLNSQGISDRIHTITTSFPFDSMGIDDDECYATKSGNILNAKNNNLDKDVLSNIIDQQANLNKDTYQDQEVPKEVHQVNAFIPINNADIRKDDLVDISKNENLSSARNITHDEGQSFVEIEQPLKSSIYNAQNSSQSFLKTIPTSLYESLKNIISNCSDDDSLYENMDREINKLDSFSQKSKNYGILQFIKDVGLNYDDVYDDHSKDIVNKEIGNQVQSSSSGGTLNSSSSNKNSSGLGNFFKSLFGRDKNLSTNREEIDEKILSPVSPAKDQFGRNSTAETNNENNEQIFWRPLDNKLKTNYDDYNTEIIQLTLKTKIYQSFFMLIAVFASPYYFLVVQTIHDKVMVFVAARTIDFLVFSPPVTVNEVVAKEGPLYTKVYVPVRHYYFNYARKWQYDVYNATPAIK